MVNGISRETSARNKWLELIFGFRIKFNMTVRKISGGNEQPCVNSGVQTSPEISSRLWSESGGYESGLNTIFAWFLDESCLVSSVCE